MRATMSAIMLFCVNLIGSGGGPQVAGMVNDALAPRFGEEAIRYSLLLLSCALPWAAVHYLLAARTYREDLGAKESP